MIKLTFYISDIKSQLQMSQNSENNIVNIYKYKIQGAVITSERRPKGRRCSLIEGQSESRNVKLLNTFREL